MSNRIQRCLLAVCAIAFAVLWASPTRAQMNQTAKPTLYTYVAEWSVPRAQWPVMEKSDTSMKAAMDKLVADGTIVGYGSFKTVVHQEGHPTHGSWFQAMSMGNLMKALAAVMATPEDNNPALAASKHSDFILDSTQYGFQSGTFENSYLRVGTWIVKPGSGETIKEALKNYIVPSLEKLLADGSIRGYQVDEEAIHTEDPGMIDVAILTNGADGLDKYYAALAEAGKKSPLSGIAFDQGVDESGHRDILALVPSFTRK
ncbi:MAG: hypothetical protein ACRD4S_14295 [Candidatus Acidiferrales bacterium]